MKKDRKNFLFCIILSKNFRTAHFLPVSTVIVSLMIAVLRSLHRNGATWQATASFALLPSRLARIRIRILNTEPQFFKSQNRLNKKEQEKDQNRPIAEKKRETVPIMPRLGTLIVHLYCNKSVHEKRAGIENIVLGSKTLY